MFNTFAITESAAFTVTHARHMAAKVATDLKRMQRLYDFPSDADIDAYEAEVIALLKGGVPRNGLVRLQTRRALDRADDQVHGAGSIRRIRNRR